MLKTYLDANVLIAAYRGDHPVSSKALQLLGASNRSFIASQILRLETLRKPLFYIRNDEIDFMNTFYEGVSEWVEIDDSIVIQALDLAAKYDMGAIDALHIALAKRGKVDEFVTMERPTSPIFRALGLKVVSLHPKATG
jgi:predicted nucleic acid-binding protein